MRATLQRTQVQCWLAPGPSVMSQWCGGHSVGDLTDVAVDTGYLPGVYLVNVGSALV